MYSRNAHITELIRQGADARAVDLARFPMRLRYIDGSVWECPFVDATNYYTRRPMSGSVLRETLNSESVDWGSDRSGAAITTITSDPLDEEDLVIGDALQRWHFPHDFEAYGMMLPLQNFSTSIRLKLKLALFQTFPFNNSTQAWRILPGAKFMMDQLITNPLGQEYTRKLLIPFDPTNFGRLVIPSGWYWLFVLPGAGFSADFYVRTVRDYENDDSLIWRGDRYRVFDSPEDWGAYDYDEVVFINDGTAPPTAPCQKAPPTGYGAVATIDFSFFGRFV